MQMTRKLVDVAIIIPDASPILTLARVGRMDLLDTFAVPIHIPDQVIYEVQKPENDLTGLAHQWISKALQGNQVVKIETTVGLGFAAGREKDPNYPSGGLGELAVEEYAQRLAKTGGPNFVPLVLFEDPDVLDLKIARLKNIHLLNTAGWLLALERAKVITDGVDTLRLINKSRKTQMIPFDKPALTKKVRSTFIREVVQK